MDYTELPRYKSAIAMRVAESGMYTFTGSSAATFMLSNINPSMKRRIDGAIWFFENAGTATLTLQSNSGNFFDGATVATVQLAPGEAATVVHDNGAYNVVSRSGNRSVLTTVTSAQVLALNATPITVVAAKGAGLAVVPLRFAISKAAGTAYGGIAAGEDLVLKYTDGSGAECSAQMETTGFLDQATAQSRFAGMASTAVAPVANAAVVLHLLSGEITTGTSDLVVRVWFDVIQTAFTA